LPFLCCIHLLGYSAQKCGELSFGTVN